MRAFSLPAIALRPPGHFSDSLLAFTTPVVAVTLLYGTAAALLWLANFAALVYITRLCRAAYQAFWKVDAQKSSDGKGMALDQRLLFTTLMTICAAFLLAIMLETSDTFKTGTWMEHCWTILGSVAKVIFGEFLVITTMALWVASFGCLVVTVQRANRMVDCQDSSKLKKEDFNLRDCGSTTGQKQRKC
nr:hypothetical protein B0A51_05570 [Rachicladosporium sp. CCFEE 5018]